MEIPRGRRVSKAKFLNESMTLKGNFRRDGGFNLKNLPWEGYGYFLEQHSVPLSHLYESGNPVVESAVIPIYRFRPA